MKLAVLMSTYNGENYLRTQIDSILAQQGDFSLDLWVRDDGSRDGTCAILQEYADRGALRWYTGDNLRPARSFLDLVRHCPDYDCYAFADQDDYWHPDKLAAGVKALEGMEMPAISCANARLVDGAGEYLGRNVYRMTPHRDFYSVCCGPNIMGCTMTFNRALARLLQAHPVPENMLMHDALLLNICTLYGGQILFDSRPHMDYRQHGANVVGAQWTKMDALKSRLKEIRTREKVSIADQAQAILKAYPDIPDGEERKFLRKVADYRTSFGKTLAMACSRKPHYNGLNMAVTKRLAIFMRNR